MLLTTDEAKCKLLPHSVARGSIVQSGDLRTVKEQFDILGSLFINFLAARPMKRLIPI